MPNSDDILWFKQQFQARIEPRLAETPLTVDFLAAIACQETGNIWPVLRRKGLPTSQVLALCVGDTLDDDKGRTAFPRNKSALLAKPRGQEMFAIAHQALVDMAQHVPGFDKVAARPAKFCHGFGIFQRDLQFFLEDPDYFLQKQYENFEDALDMCLAELKRALNTLGVAREATLSDLDLAHVGIAYNTGGFNPRKGLQQGHFNGSRFYGEETFDFIRLAHTVALPGAAPLLPAPAAGSALVPPPSPVTARGEFFRVDTVEGMLRLRSEPRKSVPPQANVIGHMPDGHRVRAVNDKVQGGFREVETSLSGALLHGFASQKFLDPDPVGADIPVAVPAEAPPASGIVAVIMRARPGRITRRKDPANAQSLNEPNQPGRTGTTPQDLRGELAAIIDWLEVNNPAFARYQPRDGLTFCNIYAHDYCHLAGVYLPRVWWTPKALVSLNHDEEVAPHLGATIAEMRANDLFRWLRDFGMDFGWRQTGNLTKLQQAANQGAIGLILARRKEDGRSGHIVVAVPESTAHSAKRDANGEVVAPLQSQAGAKNFQYGNGKANWWKGEEFAESAFWVHA